MSREQRKAVDAMLRRPRLSNPQTVEEMRASFAAMMATMRAPEDVRTTPTILGNRLGAR